MGRLFVLSKIKQIPTFLSRHILKVAIGFLLAFIPLYPKLPLLGIRHTWVYIRAEDLLLLIVTLIWLTQLFRKKLNLKTPLTITIFAYWFVGGISLLFSLLFLRSQLADFFPSVAALHFLRRIEYMLPFFIAFSTVKSLRDIKHYAIIISLTLVGVVFYGFGQRYLGFPAYLTMNEEFAKGIPLYLPPTARVTSTFAGHYDLAAFLVVMIAFLGSLIFGLRNKIFKLFLFILVFSAFILLLFTASRVSFGVYLLAVSYMLYLQKKKWLIFPVVAISIFLMLFISGASERFAKTLRIQKVVYSTKTGQPIAVLEEKPAPKEAPPPENLPLGSGFLPVPVLEKAPEATTVARIRRQTLASLKTASTSSEIATISGDFLIRRTIVYDISFTTRFQGEWPRALDAFKRNPLLGSGYSSISLATDGDYMRALGETGILGILSLLLIFSVIFLILRRALKTAATSFERSVIVGFAAAFLSLLFNAILIDIFEASKVAFSFWMLSGITLGMINLKKTHKESLFKEAQEVIRLKTTHILILFGVISVIFAQAMNNYFSGDDFTWLKWAATSSTHDLWNFFLSSDRFFYRPLTKTYFTLVQPFFGLRPQGYHLIDFLLYFGSTLAVYFISLSLTKKKIVAFMAALFFLTLPAHTESVTWIASTSALTAAFFYLWSLLLYLWQRQILTFWRHFLFTASVILFALGIFSHELALTLPAAILLTDILFLKKPRKWLYRLVPLLPYFLVIDVYLWLRAGSQALGLNGDYSYNIKNLPFNILGNLWGYLGTLLIGDNFIPLYDYSRSYFRHHSLWAAGIIFGALLVLILLFRQEKLKHFVAAHLKILIFTFGWFIITLSPFLGLGNIAERYAYLASFAFVLFLAIIINWIWENIKKRSPALALASVLSVTFLIGGFYWQAFSASQKNWKTAGEITNRTLLALSSNYAEFPPKSTLYFVDLPIREKRAWVFPVGLEDGLWLIYRDETLKIEKNENLKKATDLAEEHTPSHVFIFQNSELKESKKED